MAIRKSGVLDAASILKEDLASQIYRVIAHRIVTREYTPGERLSIQAVADSFDVSVTPVREAFQRLALEGLLEIQPRRGTIVTRITQQDLLHLYEIRMLIETHAARQPISDTTLAAMEDCIAAMAQFDDGRLYEDFELYWNYSSYDSEFHHLLVAASHNPRLLEIYKNLHTHALIAPVLFGLKASDRGVAQRQEHRNIVDALAAGDGSGAARAVEDHLSRTLEVLRHRWPESTPERA